MRYEIKSIPIWPFTKVSFFYNLVIGFIIGLFYAMIAGLLATVMAELSLIEADGFEYDSLPIGFLMVLMPFLCAFFCAAFNTVAGIVLIFVYNLIARLVGGLELNLSAVEEETPPPSQPAVKPARTEYGPPPPPPPPQSVRPRPPMEPPPTSAAADEDAGPPPNNNRNDGSNEPL